jgi:hypothetical protein
VGTRPFSVYIDIGMKIDPAEPEENPVPLPLRGNAKLQVVIDVVDKV